MRTLLMIILFAIIVALCTLVSLLFIPSDPEEAITYSPIILCGIGIGITIGFFVCVALRHR